MATITNPIFMAPDSRWKIMELSPSLLFDCLFSPRMVNSHDGKERVRAVRIEGIPDDAKIMAICADNFNNRFLVRVWSSTFPVVEEGCLHENMAVSIQDETLALEPWQVERLGIKKPYNAPKLTALTPEEAEANGIVVSSVKIARLVERGFSPREAMQVLSTAASIKMPANPSSAKCECGGASVGGGHADYCPAKGTT